MRSQCSVDDYRELPGVFTDEVKLAREVDFHGEVTDEGWALFQPSSRKTLTVCLADGGQLECDVSNVEFKPGEPASITVQFPIEAGDVIWTKDGYFEAMRVFEDAKGNTWIDTMNGAYPRDNVLLSNGWSE